MKPETEPCFECEKEIDITKPHWRVEYWDQGWYAIGPECRKKHPEAKRWRMDDCGCLTQEAK